MTDTATMTIEDLIERVADRVLARLSERQRDAALRVREEMIHGLRAYEAMYGLPQAVPPKREREG